MSQEMESTWELCQCCAPDLTDQNKTKQKIWLQFLLPPTRGQTDAVTVSAQLQQSALLEVALPFLDAGFLLVHLVDDDVQLPLHDVDLPLRQLLLSPPQLLLLLPLLLRCSSQRLLPRPQLLQRGEEKMVSSKTEERSKRWGEGDDEDMKRRKKERKHLSQTVKWWCCHSQYFQKLKWNRTFLVTFINPLKTNFKPAHP